MRRPLEEMEFDELLLLHEDITKVLSEKITAEKRELEKRLAKLNQAQTIGKTRRATNDRGPRRKYAKVLPKYRNPASMETWSGRGKQPRWLIAALKAGHTIQEFEIRRGEGDVGETRGESTLPSSSLVRGGRPNG